MNAHVLMLSSSRHADEPYLAHAKPHIHAHLNTTKEVLFVPFAGVNVSYDDYTKKVADALPELTVIGLHTFSSPADAIAEAKAKNQGIMVGGGNTFHLLYTLYEQNLIPLIQHAVAHGVPYIGWSAGSNICGATIKTTNDMPIIAPPSFDALDFISCQLNPHYTDFAPAGFNGETRDQRLREFTTVNPTTPVLAIREGTALILSAGKLAYMDATQNQLDGVIFLANDKHEINTDSDLTQFIDYCR